MKSNPTKKFCQLFVSLLISFSSLRLTAQTHPILLSPSHLGALQTTGNTEWNTISSFCSNNLDEIIDPGYAGWDWHDALMNYATAYQVLKDSDPSTADKYARKALALMKVVARHHNYGGPQRDQYSFYDGFQFVGLGDGSTKNFSLPFNTRLAGSTIEVTQSPIITTSHVYNSNKTPLNDFQPILKISNTNGGGADYVSADYQFLYKDGTDVFTLIWGTNHPANGATYYVTQTSGGISSTPVSTGFTVSGGTISFTTAPAAGKAVFVRMIDADYNQTGNLMGGLSSAQPDAGYQMRTFNPGLAYGIDLLYNYSGLTGALKTEFVNVLNAQLTWYKQYGYENSGVDFGNYFIEGLVTGTMYTAYGTDGINASAQQYKDDARSYLQDRIFNDLNTELPGGYGPQGQYTDAVFTDIITLFSLYKDITGTDLLAQTEWTDNMIRASIHGTKPDRQTFYDGGDWDDYPATPMTGMINTYLTYLPNSAMAPYARQYLKDLNYSPAPVGTTKDYKTDFPLSYLCKVSSPVYARSDWGANAVWLSFVADNIIGDHQHLEQGHFSIQRGADYLLINGGQYGALSTLYNNTLLFDDRGAGNISVYPPGQGYWGTTNKITRYEAAKNYMYSQADFTSSYQSNFNTDNSVTAAIRSVLYIRPGIVFVHDKANVQNVNVKKIFNLNFPVAPSQNGSVYTETVGNSSLFFKSLLPNTPAAVIAPITLPYDPQKPDERSFQVTKTGSLQDNFFYVFEATDKTQASMSNVTYADGGSFELASTTIADTGWTVVFPKQVTIAGGTRMNYSITTTGNHHDLITDVAPNTDFSVTVISGTQMVMDAVIRSSDEGVLSYMYTTGADPGTVFINKTVQAGVTHIINATEGGGNGSFTITLSNVSAVATTVSFTLTGTAINGTDYTTIPATAVIPAGALSVTVPVIAINDNVAEPTETVVITLQGVTSGTVDNTPQTLNIFDNNTVQAGVTNIVNATEGGTDGSFTITLSNPSSQATTVSFTLTGTAINGTDYTTIPGTAVIPAGTLSVTVPVITINDQVAEPTETVVITLQSATNSITIDNTPQTLNIFDNDASHAGVKNIVNTTEGGTNGSFTIALTNPSSVSTTVSFILTGTAINGTDYTTIPGSVVIPAGALTVTVPVTTIDDHVAEPTETVVITLQSATNSITIDNTPQTLNLFDNDVSQAGVTNMVNATEGGTNGSFTITLSNPSSQATTVSFTLTGTAINGTDYTTIPGTVVIPAGALSVTVPVTAIDDHVSEPTETVVISLQGATNGVTIDNTPHTLNLFDNDVSQAGVTNIINAIEGVTNGSFTITLSNPSSQTTTVSFTLTGTAINGIDYTTIPGSVVIPAGTLSVTVPVIAVDDHITEPTETVVITLQGATNGITIDNTPLTLNIFDHDASIAGVKNIVNTTEGGTSGSFTITLSNPSSQATTVSFTLTGTAINGTDYTIIPGSVVIPAGTFSVTVPVTAIDDHVSEPTETVVITLQSATNGVIVDNTSQTLNIFDNDVSQAGVTNMVNATEGGNNGSFTVTLSNPSSVSTTVLFTLTGTAINGTDYTTFSGTVLIPAGTLSVTVPVTATDDHVSEPTETVVITLQSATNGVTIDNTPQTLNIFDNDVSQAGVTNISNATEGGTDGSFTVTLSNPSSVSTTVSFTLTGTAINGTDYTTIPGSVEIPAGTLSVTVPVTAIDDHVSEPTETVVITLRSATNGVTIDNTPQTLNIFDNDVSQAGITNIINATEGGTDGSFTITLSNPSSQTTTVSFTLTGTAINGADYTTIPGTVVIPAGALAVTVPVTAIDDHVSEPTETVVITLQSATNGIMVDNTPDTLNIFDNDALQAGVTNIINATEGGTNGSFTIALTNPSSQATTVSFTLTGTAINGTDYTTIPGSVVIPAGTLSVTVPVIAIDDHITEPAETTVITLQSATNGVTIDNTPQTLNIFDNDASQAGVTNMVNATEGGTNGSFTITLSNPSSQATTISFTLTGTAINGTDYTTIPGTVVIPAGALSVTVPVSAIDDHMAEPTETVVITLQSATNGITVDNTPQTLNIFDNDVTNNALQAGITHMVNATEGGANGSFTINLANPLSVATTVTFTLTGTAINGIDYTTIPGSVVIPAGALSVTVPVIAIDDHMAEPTETVVITLQSATNGIMVDNTPHTLNIFNNNAVTDLTKASITDIVNATEGGGSGSFTINLANPLSVATTVTFTLTGTAINGTDYRAITGVVEIPVRANKVTVPVIAIDDHMTEPTETVVITLQSVTNGTVDNTPKTLNIFNNNAIADLTKAIVSHIVNATEGGGNGSFTINLTKPLSVATTVTFTLTGTAINGIDYTAISGTVVIPARANKVTVPVIAIDDHMTEPTRKLVITLQSATNGTVDNTPKTLNIFDHVVTVPPTPGSKNSFSAWGDDHKMIHIVFSLENPDNVSIVVYDLNGRALSRQSKEIGRGRTMVDVNNQRFPPGIYVVQVTIGGIDTGKKIFVR